MRRRRWRIKLSFLYLIWVSPGGNRRRRCTGIIVLGCPRRSVNCPTYPPVRCRSNIWVLAFSFHACVLWSCWTLSMLATFAFPCISGHFNGKICMFRMLSSDRSIQQNFNAAHNCLAKLFWPYLCPTGHSMPLAAGVFHGTHNWCMPVCPITPFV